jgi:hypothetical protein
VNVFCQKEKKAKEETLGKKENAGGSERRISVDRSERRMLVQGIKNLMDEVRLERCEEEAGW